jgi:hypothetical protein
MLKILDEKVHFLSSEDGAIGAILEILFEIHC